MFTPTENMLNPHRGLKNMEILPLATQSQSIDAQMASKTPKSRAKKTENWRMRPRSTDNCPSQNPSEIEKMNNKQS